MRTAGLRLATWAIAFVVGAVYGVAGTVAHAYAPLGIPVGLVLSIVGLAALLVAIRLLLASRWATLAAGLGAAGATLLFSGTGPGGSVLMPAGALSIAWAVAVPVLVALAVAWPDLGERTPQTPPTGPPAPPAPPAPPRVGG